MKRLPLTLLVLSLAAAGIGDAAAQRGDDRDRDFDRDRNEQHDGRGRDTDRNGNELRNDTARVTRVEQLFTHQGRVRQECWNEGTSRHESGYYRDEQGRLYRDGKDSNANGALIGAIVGGLLGNQVGDGRGRTAATVAGAAVGAAVGHNVDDNDRYDRFRDNTGTERRCRTVEMQADRGRGHGRDSYRVTYVYAGQTYQTMTGSHPGRNLRVLVDVRPQQDDVADRRR